MLHDRLSHLERDLAELKVTIGELQNGLSLVKVEQGHAKELVSSRLSLIDKSIELLGSKLESLSRDILTMASDADKTPAGRSLLSIVNQTNALSAENADTIEANAQKTVTAVNEQQDQIDELKTWKNNIEGVVYFLKWLGAAGAIALLATILRALKIIP
jgi:chromosome segregation ATPase